jgi:dTDP-glucose 4,6-dehydratase
VYNFGGGAERENIAVVRRILAELEMDERLIAFVADRPGHDRRYNVSYERAQRELGWQPTRTLEEGLGQTGAWYLEHREWWETAATQAYRHSGERIDAWHGNAMGPNAQASAAAADA